MYKLWLPAGAGGLVDWHSTMAFLQLQNVTKTFGDHTAVSAINLTVQKGEFLSLLGPSGCGKTTTLQMIAGFVTLTEGRICLDGRDLSNIKPADRGLGIVFQSYALFPHMTAAQNVAFGLEMRSIPRADRDQRVRDVLTLVGLSGYEERFPRRMSGGQQQRVALARALVIRPQILLLDEPLSNLDAKLREEMQIELRQIQRNLGTTTILVTHDQQEAMALSDRIVVMNKGIIEQIGSPQDTYQNPASAFVATFLGKTNAFAGTAFSSDDGKPQIRIVDHIYSSLAQSVGPVIVTVRPERISFGTEGLRGTVRTRIFQGNHWLFQIETDVGIATVIRQNDGALMPEEGNIVHLNWREEDTIVRATDKAA